MKKYSGGGADDSSGGRFKGPLDREKIVQDWCPVERKPLEISNIFQENIKEVKSTHDIYFVFFTPAELPMAARARELDERVFQLSKLPFWDLKAVRANGVLATRITYI